MAQAEAAYFAELAEIETSPKPARGRRSRADEERDEARAATLRLPFGFANRTWEALKAMMQPGDELWEFCSPKSEWDALMGRAGYELIREGVVICTIISRMN